jgi:hypothetical protein
MIIQKNKLEMPKLEQEEVLDSFKSKLDFVRRQVIQSGVEGIKINPNSSVFEFRKGANHTRL